MQSSVHAELPIVGLAILCLFSYLVLQRPFAAVPLSAEALAGFARPDLTYKQARQHLQLAHLFARQHRINTRRPCGRPFLLG